MNLLNGVFIILLFTGLLPYTPRLVRPDVFFGVTVACGFRTTAAGAAIFQAYAKQILAHTAVAVLIALIIDTKLFIIALTWQWIGAAVAYSCAKRKAVPHAQARNRVLTAPLRRTRETVPLGWTFSMVPIVAIAATGLYLQWNIEHLPPKMPVHWGLNGPDRFVNTTPMSVLGLTLTGLTLATVMLFAILGILRSRRLAHSGAAASLEVRFRRANAWILLGVAYMMGLLFAGMPLAYLHGFESIAGALVNASVVVVLVLAAWTVRLKMLQNAEPDDSTGDRTPDEAWKLGGHAYFNRDDPSFFVEKRFGIGYTLNFANWRAWAFLGTILLTPLAFSILAA